MKAINYKDIEFKLSAWGVKARPVVNINEISIMNLVLVPYTQTQLASRLPS